MVSVRKIKDDDEKFTRLTKVYTHYQGAYKDNWFHCNLCKERFLCIHERLQLNAFLKPVEKSIIEKEIILNCSGGQFQGKYICRNCGQPMRELDFDNNLEFDDDGKPKSGRSVVEDKDAILEEKIEMMVNATVENTEKDNLNLNEEETVCYEVARELSERVGIELDRSGYRFIIQYTLMVMSKFPNKLVYAKYRQTKPDTIPTYEVAFSRKYISVCAVLLLIEIQTKIPAYKVRYALRGCDSPGFGGYPIAGDKEKTEGINYLSCAISTIRRQDGMFYQTGYHLIADPAKRTLGIMKYLQNVMETDIMKLDIVQANLAAKIAYMDEMDGGSDVAMDSRPRDQIPASFLPEQVVLKPEDAAKDVITPEVAQAMGTNGRTALIKLWIRQAHRIAQENARVMRGSPLSEVSCCFHPISQGSDQWFKELPALDSRKIIPNRQGQFMVTEFIPREAAMAVSKPNPELYYRLFLKYCFHGPNMGRPHEPGLTNLCTWCGFEFPTHPSIMDVEKQGLTAIQSQNVDTSDEKFTELLDTIHNVNRVEAVKQNEHRSVEDILTEFSKVTPSPTADWKEVIEETTQAFLKLPPRAMRSDMVQARARISDAVADSITRFSTYFPKKGDNEVIYAILDKIAELPWSNFFQIIQTYFITTLQRLLSNYSDKAMFVPIELVKDLSDIHVKSDIQPRLEKELAIVSKYREPMQKDSYSFVRSKLRFFLKQLSTVLPYKNIIRAVLVPDRDRSLVYFQKFILFGCLATLIDPDHIPDEDVGNPIKSSGKSASKAIITLLVDILRKYRTEYISYDEQEIRNQIAIREEKERVHVISEFNKLSEEERKIELINKKLGIGKWAVGGTSLTYKYNKDYYDLERLKREQGGYGGHSDDSGVVEYGAQEYDENGYPVMDEEERDASFGYDMEDQPDD
jgi:predicted transport protein